MVILLMLLTVVAAATIGFVQNSNVLPCVFSLQQNNRRMVDQQPAMLTQIRQPRKLSTEASKSAFCSDIRASSGTRGGYRV